MATGASSLLSPPGPADYMPERKGASLSLSEENKPRLSDPEQSHSLKLVLVEKTNRLGLEAAASRGRRDAAPVELALSTALNKPRPDKPCAGQRQSAFTQLAHLQERLGGIWAQEREPMAPQTPVGQLDSQRRTPDVPRTPAGGTAWPGTPRGEQRSAFRKPAKRPVEQPGCHPMRPAEGNAEGSGEFSGHLNTVDIPCWPRLSTSKLVGDFWNLHMLSQNILLCSSFRGAPSPWPELAQVPTPSVPSTTASPALLPPTLSSLGLSTQNWCAKCSLAFRLTADLVFHMRSHHKRESAGPDPHSRKRRAEALTCPVCHEYFRERHHLSRHMTSHS
uniref:zinc finger protein 488 n=1 Tax=Jaculus jaculus TaxID=51337 RepID=UPI001E1AF6C9|nr:zinc finger protein 488 [Jaculus jaculus]XP_044993726.1 zinc finger protein 488 [Jaculus jaculus]XP_044993727.1 zinc finger protein 488 [Jaculus jaculus]